jgi:hypothetical protein
MPEDSWWVAHVCDLESSGRCGYVSGFRLGHAETARVIPQVSAPTVRQAPRVLPVRNIRKKVSSTRRSR